MSRPLVTATVISAAPAAENWPPGATELVEDAWPLLRENLLQRGPDTVAVVMEDPPHIVATLGRELCPSAQSVFACCWLPRPFVREQLGAVGRALAALDEPCDPACIRVVVVLKSGDTGTCRIPLASVTTDHRARARA